MSRSEQREMRTGNGARTVVRRFLGPEAREVFVLCRPNGEREIDIFGQTESIYRTLDELLRAEGGGGLRNVTHETVFFRDIRNDIDGFRRVHAAAYGEVDPEVCRPASTLIQQPPLDPVERLQVAVSAIIPRRRGGLLGRVGWNQPACGCGPCAQSTTRIFPVGGHEYLYAGSIHGTDGDAFDEAYGMFRAAEDVLRKENLTFHDVVRTWIYLRDIDRDYAELNRARGKFFEQAGIRLRPASTGIQGVPFPPGHNFSLSLYAIKSPRPLEVEIMTTPTLNEAWMYGSDFSRGLKVVEANKIALYVSGTASVDEAGRTAHVDDFDAQAERMLLNISTLLSEQNASFGDLVSAVTYLKRPADAGRLRGILNERGLDAVPNALVEAPVCRPDLLCEMEAVAVLPRAGEGIDAGVR